MDSSRLNRSVSWGTVTVMGSNSVIQIDSSVEQEVQPANFRIETNRDKIREFVIANNLEHMLPRESVELNRSSLFNPPLHSTPFAANRKRRARASPPTVDLTDESQGTYDDVKYDPMERGCLRSGLRLRRFSHPYWINSGQRNIGIVYGTMTAKGAQQEAKFERERRKSRYTVNQIVPEVHIVKFSPGAKLEKLRGLEEHGILPKRKTLNRRPQNKKHSKESKYTEVKQNCCKLQ